ncbi:MAG TPA: hypothetical protein VGO97_06130 [Solirubrobacterales bacterium]|nr:hypothetical protein [Solirubrobacterales bacterium]
MAGYAPLDRGYESFYLKAGAPKGDCAAWIRYTLHRRPNHLATASVWCTLFERKDARPRAVKQTFSVAMATVPENAYVAIADSWFSPTCAIGRIGAAGRSATWDIDIESDEPPLLHLPERLYETSLPRTKLLTPRPGATFGGTIEFDGDEIEIDGWSGAVGHNWGAEHAESWIWLHGIGFDGFGEDTWIDVAIGKLKIGKWRTPWIANGVISIEGERRELGGLRRPRGVKVNPRTGRIDMAIKGDGVELDGAIAASSSDIVGWEYAGVDGDVHHVLNSSVADVSLVAIFDDGRQIRLHSTGGGVYEYGSRDKSHGIPIEPFADGEYLETVFS